MKNLPIGVFDSGIGGITILKALEAKMPQESFVYLADTARLPYGDKTSQEIITYFHDVVDWMQSYPVKMLVVACNTSSSLALDNLSNLPFPIVGTIHPTVSKIALNHKKLGIIATTATVQSGAFEKALKKVNPTIEVYPMACPKLVPLIEKHDLESNEVFSVLQEYINPLVDQNIDGLIYGCTHYPHLSSAIEKLLPKNVAIINPAEHVAVKTSLTLQEKKYLKTHGVSDSAFYTTGSSKDFQISLNFFYGKKASLHQTILYEKQKIY